MIIIEIENTSAFSVIEQLNASIKGTITLINGEEILKFNNAIGTGTIRHICFDWGITLLDYDAYFNEEVKINYKIIKETPIEFLFISEGKLKYNNLDFSNDIELKRFQNIIISNTQNSKNVFVFPSKTKIQLNTIQVLADEYAKKKNFNINSLQKEPLALFRGHHNNLPFLHLGNYSLKIADKIKDLNNAEGHGIAKSLCIEGHLNLILSMQLLEYKKFINHEVLPDSLSKSDVNKLYNVVSFIVENVSQDISIKTLSSAFGLSPKKLQSGFKLLYSKSVNEYVRRVKLEIARDMIKSSEMTISEIVYHIGYRSRSYFSKLFYEQYDILPTDYRESIKTSLKSKNA